LCAKSRRILVLRRKFFGAKLFPLKKLMRMLQDTRTCTNPVTYFLLSKNNS